MSCPPRRMMTCITNYRSRKLYLNTPIIFHLA